MARIGLMVIQKNKHDAGERPGENARPYPGFFCPDPGPGFAPARKSSQKNGPDRTSSQKYTQMDAPGRTSTQDPGMSIRPGVIYA